MTILSPVRNIIRSPVRSTPFGGFLPSDLPNLAAWYQFNKGITVTGAGVSQWNDQSGNSRHLLQGTDANRPTKNANGSILFDGLAHFLKTNAFTLNQPTSIFLLVKQATWSTGDRICDGDTGNSGSVYQVGTTPEIRIYAGVNLASLTDLTLDTYGVLSIEFNGANGSMQVNKLAAITGNVGASNMGGFILGAFNDAGSSTSNIEVKDVAIYSAILSAADKIQVIDYHLSL